MNRAGEPVAVRVTAEAGAGGRVVNPQQPVRTCRPAAARNCAGTWSSMQSKTVGDTRLRFGVLWRKRVAGPRGRPVRALPRWVRSGPFPALPGQAYSTPSRRSGPRRRMIAFVRDGREDREVAAGARRHVVRHDGVDFIELFGPREQAAAYAMTRIESERDQDVELRFGSDDTLTVWLNGKRIHSVETYRLAAPDQEIVKATLRAGVNTLLVKDRAGQEPVEIVLPRHGPDGAPAVGIAGRVRGLRVVCPAARDLATVPARALPFRWHLLGPIAEVPSKATRDGNCPATAWPCRRSGRRRDQIPWRTVGAEQARTTGSI